MELRDFLNSASIALYMQELPPETSIDAALFPNKKQLSTKIELAKGAKQKPVALRMSAFDVATKIRALSADLSIKTKEIPVFKEGIGIDETTRRDLINAVNCNNQNLVDALVDQVFNNYVALVEGAHIRAKAMRCQAIQNGVISITTEDGDIEVDYEIPADHKSTLTGNDCWNVASADIVGDIKDFQDAIVNDNYRKPTIVLMTERTFQNTFMINTAITNHIKNSNLNTTLILSEQDYLNFAKDRLGLTIVFLDSDTQISSYVNEAGETVNYYEDGKITFMSGNTLGQTIYSVTQEEYDKLYGTGKLDTTVIENGIAITTMVKEDPITVDTKISVMVIPSFERADECYFSTVYTA